MVLLQAETALMLACRAGDSKLAQLLVAAGADLNQVACHVSLTIDNLPNICFVLMAGSIAAIPMHTAGSQRA